MQNEIALDLSQISSSRFVDFQNFKFLDLKFSISRDIY